MQQRIITAGLAVAVSVALMNLGCATTPTGGEGAAANAGPEDCFRVKDVRGFTALHDRFVYVECLGNEHYLLTMENVCLGLTHALSIVIANDFNRVCSNRRASIVYRDFNRRRGCRIREVEAVPDKATAKRIVKERTSTGSSR